MTSWPRTPACSAGWVRAHRARSGRGFRFRLGGWRGEVSVEAIKWAFDQRVGDPLVKFVLVALANFAEPADGLCWPKQEILLAMTEVSERKLRYAMKAIESAHGVRRVHRWRASGRLPDLYQFPPGARRQPVPQTGSQPAPHAGSQPAPHAGSQPAPHAGSQPAPHAGSQPAPHAGPTGTTCRSNRHHVPVDLDPSIDPLVNPKGSLQRSLHPRARGASRRPPRGEDQNAERERVRGELRQSRERRAVSREEGLRGLRAIGELLERYTAQAAQAGADKAAGAIGGGLQPVAEPGAAPRGPGSIGSAGFEILCPAEKPRDPGEKNAL